jgi:hypothetical protein
LACSELKGQNKLVCLCQLFGGAFLEREYLEDYSQKESEEIDKMVKQIKGKRYSFEKDRFPRNNRFINIKEPVAVVVGIDTTNWESIWAQIPFSGSLLLYIHPCDKESFEQFFFKVEKISEVIDFVKDTGRLQIALNADPKRYIGLDYLEPIFRELNPPWYHMMPLSLFAEKNEIKKYMHTFGTLASVKLFDILQRLTGGNKYDLMAISDQLAPTYTYLKAAGYSFTEDIEDLLIDDPMAAYFLLCMCRDFIVDPATDLRCTIRNAAFNYVQTAQSLPNNFRPQPFFPVEIGKFLVQKLTFAAKGIRACNQIIDNYAEYDLRKIQSSLNDGIVNNRLDVVNDSTESLSEILENVWNDKTIINRIKNIKVGVPVSIAAIGGIAGAIVGGASGAVVGAAAGDFLTKIGFKVGEKSIEKLFDQKGKSVTEALAKIRTKSYQANIYDFQNSYEEKIRS